MKCVKVMQDLGGLCLEKERKERSDRVWKVLLARNRSRFPAATDDDDINITWLPWVRCKQKDCATQL